VTHDYILREESWLDQEKYATAFERAEAEGVAEAFLVAFDHAGCFGAEATDLAALPLWAQEKLREWYGERAA